MATGRQSAARTPARTTPDPPCAAGRSGAVLAVVRGESQRPPASGDEERRSPAPAARRDRVGGARRRGAAEWAAFARRVRQADQPGDAHELGRADAEPDARPQRQLARGHSGRLDEGARVQAPHSRRAVGGELDAGVRAAGPRVATEDDRIRLGPADGQAVGQVELLGGAADAADAEDEPGGARIGVLRWLLVHGHRPAIEVRRMVVYLASDGSSLSAARRSASACAASPIAA